MPAFSIKNKTKNRRIVSLADAPVFYMPLTSYFGSHPESVVSIGDKVLKYQLIGVCSSEFGLNVHSPVSGTVCDIKPYLMADQTMAVIVEIVNDYKEEKISLPVISHENADRETLLKIIEQSGVAGEGGAQFPAAVKYKGNPGNIHTFIINGAECEPYLTADYALMAERTEKLLEGIRMVNRILNAANVVIAFEKQNQELENCFLPFLQREKYANCHIRILPNIYPQGSELQLIKTVTGMTLPKSLRPAEAGVVVSNVGTVYAVYEAVIHHQPVISRIVTVSGEGEEQYGNFEVKLGTPVRYLLEQLGISHYGKTLVLGGPMMGRHITDLSMPITKGTGGVIVLPDKVIRRENCISCGYCVEACPMHLMPMKYEELYRRKKFALLEKYNLSSCIECAACEYICPSNVPLIDSIRMGKNKLREMADAG